MALADAEDAVKGCGTKAATVLFNKLFTTLQRPTKRLRDGSVVYDQKAIDQWTGEMERYPADLVEAAVDEVVRTHAWNNTPKIADLVLKIRPEMQKRTDWLHKVRNAQHKARLSPPAKAPRIDPEREAKLAEIAKRLAAGESAASISADMAAKEAGGAMPLHPDDQMSDAHKSRLREESLRRAEHDEEAGHV